MDPTVVAAWIAAGASGATLAVTLGVQAFSQRASTKAADKALEKQHQQLNRTLDAQNSQLDRTLMEQRKHLERTLDAQGQQLEQTLGEQRTQTLNGRFATAAELLGSDKPPEVRLAGVHAIARLADDWKPTGKPASTYCALTCGCHISLTPDQMPSGRSDLPSRPIERSAIPS